MEQTTNKPYEVLLRKLEESKQRNPLFSQRAFAKKLGLSPGALSELIAGKRPLTMDTKKKIAEKMDLSPQEKRDFFIEDLPEHLRGEKLSYFQMTNDQFHLVSDWWHYGILNLVNTKGFKPSVPWISQRLGLGRMVIEEAWLRLFRLGFLEKTKVGVKRKHVRLESSDNLFDVSVQRSHLEDLRLIEKNLVERPIEERDTTSMTLVINKKDMPLAKELIRKFHDQFSSEVESKNGDEVYRLSVSFFPLSQNQNPEAK